MTSLLVVLIGSWHFGQVVAGLLPEASRSASKRNAFQRSMPPRSTDTPSKPAARRVA
jgi:hypothetical protein